MKFYILNTPKPDSLEDRDGRIDVMKPESNVNRGPAPTCPRCGKFLGMLTWLPPCELELETWGKHYGDICQLGNDLIVSRRFREAFEQNNLHGLEGFEPVEIVKTTYRRGKPREIMPDYFKATIVRSPTAIDQQASGYVWGDDSEVCPECLTARVFKRSKREVVEDGTWNGDDVFFPRGGGGPLVSERFRSLFYEHGFFGAIFILSDSEEAGRDYFPWETEAETKG